MLVLLAALAWPSPRVAVVRPRAPDPAIHAPPCPAGHCRQITLGEATSCDRLGGPVDTVLLTGHSGPPQVLGEPPEVIADLLACLDPGLLVLDTCHGFSAPLLAALADRGLHPLVVGTTDKLSVEGLRYEPAFFTGRRVSPRRRARHVYARYEERIQRWVPDAEELAASARQVAGWDPDTLSANLQRVRPNLVRVPVDEAGVVVLYEVEPARFATAASSSP